MIFVEQNKSVQIIQDPLMRYLLPLLITFATLPLSAIEPSITGVVFDSETKEPLPFTNIAVAGQYKGTVSNIEGHFVLDRTGLDPNDTILFSYVGYETRRIIVEDLKRKSKIYLRPITINLKEVQVSSRSLSAKEIIALVIENYHKNHPNSSVKQNLFYHTYERVPFPEDQIIMKKSDFVGLDQATFEELMHLMPREFIEYQDAVVDLYSHEGNNRLIPIEGISLEEGSQKDIAKKLENILKTFFEDVKETSEDTTIYYKVRSGIFADKIDDIDMSDSTWKEHEDDPLNHTVGSDQVKNDILNLYDEYANLDSKNWEFLNKAGKYRYSKDRITLLNDELVYEITFSPKVRGLFEGKLYVSTSTYAILQLDFAYAEGKQSEKIQILGIGHAMDLKRGRVIYERAKTGYYPKYIYAQEKEWASIERSFSVMKKQKRFLKDKELNEMKFKTQLFFDINSYRELLVLDREEIAAQEFESAKQPKQMKFRKEYAYSPEMWKNRTVLAPTAELQKFKRSE